MTETQVKRELQKARRNGWWFACLYWEIKLEEYGNR
jgi:hypothetical protein